MKRQKLWYWLTLALLLVMVLAGAWRDRLSLTLNAVELETALPHPSGTSLVAEEIYIDPGPFAASRALALPKGSYQLIVRYDAERAGHSAGVYSAGMLNPDNTLGWVLAEGPLDATAGETALAFTLAAQCADIQIFTEYGGGSFTLHSVSIVSRGLVYGDHLALALLLLLLAAAGRLLVFGPARPPHTPLAQLDGAKRWQALAPLLLVVGTGLLASWPLLAASLPQGHDLGFHLARIEGIAGGWRGGQFPVRVQPAAVNGMGYLTGAMYPDLLLWPAALLRLAGVSQVGSWQALVTGINLATAGMAWYAGRVLFRSRFAGAVLCLLYTLAPYRIYNLYTRAALGEVLAMAFLPLLLLGVYSVLAGDEKRWPLLTVAACGILQSHVLSVLTSGLFVVLACLLGLKRLLMRARLLALLKAAGLALLLNLWFLLPFVWFSTQPLGVFSQPNTPWEHALQPAEVLGSALLNSTEHPALGLPLLLGAVALVAVLLRGRAKRDDGKTALAFYCLGMAALALWLCTAEFPWQIISGLPVVGAVLATVQFPWRFLSAASVLLAVCGALAAALLPQRARRWPALAALGLVCALAPLLMMETAVASTDRIERDTILDTNITASGQYLYTGSDFERLLNNGDLLTTDAGAAEGLTVSGYSKNGTTLRFRYEAPAVESLTLPLTWYPGYRAEDGDGHALAVERREDGLARLVLQTPQGEVRVWYAGLWWFRVGDVISLLALAACLAWPLLKKRRKGTVK